jgi:hypothetical protein
MKGWMVLAVVLAAGCSSSHPYLITSENCYCERYLFRHPKHPVSVEVEAKYAVNERIRSSISLTFYNASHDTLDLRQAFIKGTSRNVRYAANDRFLPLPFIVIPPGGSYSMMLEGTEPEVHPNPWHRMAGEQVVLEIKGLLFGGRNIERIVITMIPRNPHFS